MDNKALLINLEKEMGEKFVTRLLTRVSPNSETEFIQTLYEDIVDIIRQIEDSVSKRQNDEEDRITLDFITFLRQTGYDASHDNYIRGHADIIVKKGNFRWLAEAKRHDKTSYSELQKGIKQLHSRYSSGREQHSGFIIYIYTQNASKVMTTWKNKLNEHKICGLKDSYLCEDKYLDFISVHEHKGSGLDIKTRHFAILMYYKPEDVI